MPEVNEGPAHHRPALPSPLPLTPVDRDEDLALHEQVAAKIRRAIADGEGGPGERLPHARDLAAELGVTTNTVLRALRILRDEGVLDVGRGKSTVIAGTPEKSALIAQTRSLIESARRLGYQRDELITLIRALT